MYQVVIDKQVQKQLSRISAPFYTNIIDALRNLAQNPRPHGYKKLKGRDGYRVRVGNYRIIYLIKDNILTVIVINVDDRKEVYR